MIISGFTTKEAMVGMGTFYCPKCMADSSYSHIWVLRYFTLLSLPLFPTRIVDQYLRCDKCGGQMAMEMRQFTREQIKEAAQYPESTLGGGVPWLRRRAAF